MTDGQTAYDRIRDDLTRLNCNPKQSRPGQAKALCPVHEADGQRHNPSLSITRSKGAVLIKCQTGCSTEAVVAALGRKMADLYDEPVRRTGTDHDVIVEYPYVDESGHVLYIKQRLEPKAFRQYQPLADGSRSWKLNGVRRVLYRLPEVLGAKLRGEPIYMPEGEKDVHALEGLGVVATTWADGAWQPGTKPKWRTDYTQQLAGAHVIIIQDQDENGSGQQTAQDIAAKITKHAASVKIVQPAIGKDAADHIAVGCGIDDFEDVPSKPPPEPPEQEPEPERRPSIYSQTDDGNALRLIDDHGRQFRRVADMHKWFVWDDCRWAQDQEGRTLREAARDQARELPEGDEKQKSFKRNSMSATGISGAVRIAETDARVSILAAELDAHPGLINTPSGVVDLRTGTISPHDPNLLLTRITTYAVDLNAPHTQWTAFLNETFQNNGEPDTEMINYIQRIAGLALTGFVREHVLPFFWGKGRNGKTVIANVLQGLLGKADEGGYALSAPDGFLMAGRDNVHPTEIARLRGARLVVCSDQTSGNKRFDESKIKKLTGGDVLAGRFMRADFFDFYPSHLTLVLSNDRPEVREGGPAFWERVRLIPFEHVVPPEKRIPDLADRLLADEGPAILGWAACGAVEVLTNGLADPPAVLAATEEYRISEDTVASFVRDECLLAPALWCKASNLRTAYERHCAEMGAEPLSAKGLTQRLTRDYDIEPDRLSRPSRRIYRGIDLQAADEAGDDR